MNTKKILPILLALPLVMSGCNTTPTKKSTSIPTPSSSSEEPSSSATSTTPAPSSSSEPVVIPTITSLTLSEHSLTVEPGGNIQLQYDIQGTGAFNPQVFFTDDSDKVEVTNGGKVIVDSSIDVGTVFHVTVTSVQDSNKFDTCTFTVVAGVTPEQYKEKIDGFVSSIKTLHNYTMSMTSYAEDDPTDILNIDFVNLNDKAFYVVDQYTHAEGYIYQKDQGFVSFEQINGGNILPDYFMSTNPDAQISKLVPTSLEYILEASYAQDPSDPSKFIITDTQAITVALNQTGFLGIVMTIAPDSMSLSVSREKDNEFYMNIDFQIGHDEQFFDAHASYVIKNIGTTVNQKASEYIANPTQTWTAPTQYMADDLAMFEKYFNGYVPPFLTGASFGYDMYEGSETQQYNGMHFFITDLDSGDLSTSFGAALVEQGFELVNGQYYKVVAHEETSSYDNYYITLTYTAPTVQEPGQLQPVGYFNPKGIFQVEFYYNMTSDVDSVSRMNEYIVKNDLRRYVPLYPEHDTSTGVVNFRDRTAAMNQLFGDGDDYVFYTSNDFIKINYPSSALAQADAQEYINAIKARGFTDESPLNESVYCYSNPNSRSSSPAKIYVSNPDYLVGTHTQVFLMYNIYQYDTLPVDPEDPVTRVLRSISATGMTKNFHVGDQFAFDGTLQATYSNNDVETVTPTHISSPDMSTAGDKEVVITYRENGVTRTFSYKINVASIGAHSITYKFYLYGTETEVPGAINTSSSTLPGSAAKDEPFSIEIVANDGYTYNGFFFNMDIITDDSIYDQFEPYDFTESSINLNMPDCDMEFWFYFTENVAPVTKYSASFASVANVTFTPVSPADFSEITVGSTVQFSVAPAEGYDLVSVSTNDAGTTVSWVGGSTYQFTMPEKNVEISAVVQEQQAQTTPSVTLAPCEHATVSFSTVHMPGVDTSAVEPDTQIYVRVVAEEGYEIVSVTTNPETLVTNQMGGPLYSFLMPDADTTVNVTVQSTGGGEEEASIKYNEDYCLRIPMTNPAYYNEYQFRFTDDSHGTYTRMTCNAEGLKENGKLSFTYTISESGQITFTLVSGDKTSFANGYRLFDSSEPGYVNPYGQFNEDGSITVQLCREAGGSTTLTPYTFTISE